MKKTDVKDEKAKKAKSNVRKMLIIFALLAGFEAVYQLALYFERRFFPQFPVCMAVLSVTVCTLFVIIVFLNGGLGKTQLPAQKEGPEAEKAAKRKKSAKTLMMFFVPLALVLSFDIIETFFNFSEGFKNWFS